MRTVFKQWAARLRFQKHRRVPFIEAKVGAKVILTDGGRPSAVLVITSLIFKGTGEVTVYLLDEDKWRDRRTVVQTEHGLMYRSEAKAEGLGWAEWREEDGRNG